MTIYNYCGECGNPLTQDDQISCPKCGALIESKPISRPIGDQPMKKLKIKRRGWENFSWILLLLGSIIGLYGLTTPAGSFRIGDLYSWDMWMFGYNIMYDWEFGTDIFWTANPELMAISIVSTLFVIIANILAIVGAVSLIIKKNFGHWLAIISSIILFAFTLFYVIAYEIYFQINIGESFWSLFTPGFAVYGQFPALFIMIGGYLIARSASKYAIPKKRNEHEEKTYQMVKNLMETNVFSESEKEEIQNKLEIVSLRFKSLDILHRKLELLASKKQDYRFFDEGEYQKVLGYFQQIVELSPNQPVNFPKIDLELAGKIILEQDLKKAISYFKEIKRHTSLLLLELLRPSFFGFSSKTGEEWRSRTSSQRTLSYSKLTKLRLSSKSSTDSKHSDKSEERSELSSIVDSQKFPPISELMKGVPSSASTSDLEPSDKEEKDTSEDKVRNDQEDKNPEE